MGSVLLKSIFSDYMYPKSLISRINEFYVFFNKISLCYCVGMVSVTSASRYVTSASRNQRSSSMYIRGLIPRNSMELAEAVPIG